MNVPQHIVDHLIDLNSMVRVMNRSAKVFLVGGAVRDGMLGKEPKDFDFVTNLQPDLMQALDFEKVRKSFPVYHTGIGELACTRTERKTGPGYTGFESSYTPSFKEDALRRDLTINAMLWHPELGLVCPIERSMQDLLERRLHACSDAFGEDPLRILRVARMAAILGFTVTEETYKLMSLAAPELSTLPADRVRNELERVANHGSLPKFLHILEGEPTVGREIRKWFPLSRWTRSMTAKPGFALIDFLSSIPASIRKAALTKLGYGDNVSRTCATFDAILHANYRGVTPQELINLVKSTSRGTEVDWTPNHAARTCGNGEGLHGGHQGPDHPWHEPERHQGVATEPRQANHRVIFVREHDCLQYNVSGGSHERRQAERHGPLFRSDGGLPRGFRVSGQLQMRMRGHLL